MRIARIAARLSPGSVAAELGISRRSLDRTEAGTRQPLWSELLVFAQLTNQDLSFFGASADGREILSDLDDSVNRAASS